jgi:hypothetical protein
MSAHKMISIGLGVLAVSLAFAPGAQAELKFAQGVSFGEGKVANPVGVAVDQSSGEVYVGSLFNEAGVGEFGASGSFLSTFDGGGFLSGIAVNPTNNDVYVVNALAQTIETYDATGGKLSEFSIAGSANILEFFTTVQIATDSAGDVYLPNAPNNEVQEFSPVGTVLRTIKGSGVDALSAPTGVTVDPTGNVYVADAGNGRVQEFSSTGAFVTSILALGVEAVAVDATGHIYAGESNGEDSCDSLTPPCFHVVVYSPSGIRRGDFGAGAIAMSSILGVIDTLAVNQSTGVVYVGDGGNNVVRMYGPPVLLPDVATGTPLDTVASTTAKLEGVVDPDETIVSECRFYYGLSATPYAGSSQCAQALPLTGASSTPVSLQLVNLEPNATYHYRLEAANSNGTNSGEDETFTTPPAAPSLDNESASAVTQTLATLNASIDPNNEDTTYQIEYDTSEYAAGEPVHAHGTTLPEADIGSGYGDVVVGASLSDLTPDTTYHFRVIATNAAGTSVGGDRAFTTPSLLFPIVENSGVASGVSPNAATLAATVDPQGVPTTYEFDLGTDTSYGTRIFGEEALSGPGSETVSIALQGLAAGITYHYRIVAHNVFGVAYGADETFTTPSIPSELLTAPAAPPLVPNSLVVSSTASSTLLAKVTIPLKIRQYAHAARRHKQNTKRGKHKQKQGKQADGSGNRDSGHRRSR